MSEGSAINSTLNKIQRTETSERRWSLGRELQGIISLQVESQTVPLESPDAVLDEYLQGRAPSYILTASKMKQLDDLSRKELYNCIQVLLWHVERQDQQLEVQKKKINSLQEENTALLESSQSLSTLSFSVAPSLTPRATVHAPNTNATPSPPSSASSSSLTTLSPPKPADPVLSAQEVEDEITDILIEEELDEILKDSNLNPILYEDVYQVLQKTAPLSPAVRRAAPSKHLHDPSGLHIITESSSSIPPDAPSSTPASVQPQSELPPPQPELNKTNSTLEIPVLSLPVKKEKSPNSDTDDEYDESGDEMEDIDMMIYAMTPHGKRPDDGAPSLVSGASAMALNTSVDGLPPQLQLAASHRNTSSSSDLPPQLNLAASHRRRAIQVKLDTFSNPIPTHELISSSVGFVLEKGVEVTPELENTYQDYISTHCNYYYSTYFYRLCNRKK
jgi:hypothetical protein